MLLNIFCVKISLVSITKGVECPRNMTMQIPSGGMQMKHCFAGSNSFTCADGSRTAEESSRRNFPNLAQDAEKAKPTVGILRPAGRPKCSRWSNKYTACSSPQFSITHKAVVQEVGEKQKHVKVARVGMAFTLSLVQADHRHSTCQ